MAKVKVLFKFGTQAEYLALENKLDNALYFLTDTGELYKGETAIARSHVYKGSKQNNETSIDALNRITYDQTPIEGDIGIIDGDLFIKNTDEWILINASLSSVLERLSNLEFLTNNLGTLFTYKGIKDSIEELNYISKPANGDVYQVGNSEYVWNGTEWIEFGTPIDLSNYYTKTEVDNLIGSPSTSYIDDVTGDLVAVPATGIYSNISIFDGTISGLVPVLDNVEIEQKSKYFLNALGNWVTIDAGGQYTAPDGTIFNNVENYIEYMVTNYAELIWESID